MPWNLYWSVSTSLVPIAIKIACYIRIARVLRNHPNEIKAKVSLFTYSGIQLLLLLATTLPQLIYADPSPSFHTKIVIKDIMGIPEASLGLINVAVYLLQKRKRTVASQPKEDSSNDFLLEPNS